MLRGEVGAREAPLTIMVGGPERAFGKVRPLFEKMGRMGEISTPQPRGLFGVQAG